MLLTDSPQTASIRNIIMYARLRIDTYRRRNMILQPHSSGNGKLPRHAQRPTLCRYGNTIRLMGSSKCPFQRNIHLYPRRRIERQILVVCQTTGNFKRNANIMKFLRFANGKHISDSKCRLQINVLQTDLQAPTLIYFLFKERPKVMGSQCC